jgi:hypothetical protein
MIVLSHSIGTEMGQGSKKERYTHRRISTLILSPLYRAQHRHTFGQQRERNFVLDFSVSFHLIIILSDGFSFESNFDRENKRVS